jgi:hypothetical protein
VRFYIRQFPTIPASRRHRKDALLIVLKGIIPSRRNIQLMCPFEARLELRLTKGLRAILS